MKSVLLALGVLFWVGEASFADEQNEGALPSDSSTLVLHLCENDDVCRLRVEPACAFVSRLSTYGRSVVYEAPYSNDKLKPYGVGPLTECADAAVTLQPEVADGYYARALLKILLGRRDEALVDLGLALQVAPDRPELFAARAEKYMQNEKWELALDDYDRAIDLGTEDDKVFYNRAIALELLGMPEASLLAIQIAIEKAPDDLDRYVSRGIIYNSLGEHENSLKAANDMIGRHPDYAPAFNLACWTLTKFMGRHDEALSYCDGALDLAPNYAAALHSRGYAYMQMGRHKDAMKDFVLGLKIDPNDPYIISDLEKTINFLAAEPI